MNNLEKWLTIGVTFLVIVCVCLIIYITNLERIPETTFNVKVVRPNGVVHKEYTFITGVKPRLDASKSGMRLYALYVNRDWEYDAPIGWLIELEKQ